MTYKYAIVVGGSSGIGAELVRQLASSGCRVAALARRGDLLNELGGPNVLPFVHDVTQFDEIPGLFQKITGELGGLDLIIYSAGVMSPVGPDEFDFEKDRQMIEVNVLGAIAWLNQAAIRFEKTGGGTIVGIGSVAGDRGRRGQPIYNTSKAALATYLEALRNRLSEKGVRVVTIKPGPVDTELIAGLGFKNPMSAKEAARITLKKSSRAGEHYLKPVHWLMFTVIRHIPSAIFTKLKI